MSHDLLFRLVEACDAIDAVHRAFGAPGDHGYSTPQGRALYALYKQRNAMQDAIEAADRAEGIVPSPYSLQGKGKAERAELQRRRQAERSVLAEAVSAVRRPKGGAA